MPDRFRFRDSIPGPGTRASVLNYIPTGEGEQPGEVVLRLYDPIDSWGGEWGVSAKEFAAVLATIPAETSTIRLHINSPGGEVFEAVTILNQLRAHPARVVAVVDGLAASAASFLAAGADELIMGGNSTFMIHDAWGVAVGDAGVMRKAGDLLDRLSNNIAAIYADKAGGSVEDWRTAMLAESWYSAQEALDAGLADSIAEPAQSAAPANSLPEWKYSSRDEAPAPLITAKGGFPKRLRDRQNAIEKAHRLS